MKTSGFTDTSQVPRDYNLFYHCKECGDVIPSVPKDSVGCTCGNVIIDKEMHRLAVWDFDKFEVVTAH